MSGFLLCSKMKPGSKDPGHTSNCESGWFTRSGSRSPVSELRRHCRSATANYQLRRGNPRDVFLHARGRIAAGEHHRAQFAVGVEVDHGRIERAFVEHHAEHSSDKSGVVTVPGIDHVPSGCREGQQGCQRKARWSDARGYGRVGTARSVYSSSSAPCFTRFLPSRKAVMNSWMLPSITSSTFEVSTPVRRSLTIL